MDRLHTVFVTCVGLGLAAIVSACSSLDTAHRVTPPPVPAAEAPVPAPLAEAPPLPPAVEARAQSRTSFNPLLYKIWYVTNRTPVVAKGEVVDYARNWDNGTIHYGYIYAEIPEDFLKNVAHPGWIERFFPTSQAELRLTKPNEIDSSAFISDMKKTVGVANHDESEILIYLHGFNTTFKQAAQRAASIGYQLKMRATAFFSWPSQGGMRKYVADNNLAELSEDAIADFVIKTYVESGAKKIHLIAHSMGNYALLGAMYRPQMQLAIKNGLHFGQVILAAPDVETQRFKKDVKVLTGISERVSLYVSNGDLALRTSKQVAAGLARAGLTPPVVVVKGVDTVDVSATNLTFLGHAYVAEEINVLNDMHSLILHNDPPSQRAYLTPKNDYWLLQ